MIRTDHNQTQMLGRLLARLFSLPHNSCRVLPWAMTMLLLCGTVSSPPRAWAQAQTKKGAARPADPFLSGPPFKLQDLLDAVGVIYEGRLQNAIQNRGLAFPVTEAGLQQLQKAGASATFIGFLRRLNPAPSPSATRTTEARPVVRRGALTVSCAPAECSVSVGGRDRGATHEGKLTIPDLPLGEAVLDFTKDGYIAKQVTAKVAEGSAVVPAVVLEPTPEAKQKFGATLWAAMVEALGGEAGLADAAAVAAAGEAVLWDRAGQRSQWSLTARLQKPNQAYMEMRGAGANWWISLRSDAYKSGGKLRNVADTLEMESSLRLFRDYQPAWLADRIQRAKMRILAESEPGAAGQFTLMADNPTDSYELVLTPERLPARVSYRSGASGSGVTVLYSEYAKTGKTQYPRKIALKLPDGEHHGIEVRLDTVETGRQFRDRDFPK